MTATPRVLRNFINGEYVDAETDTTTDIVNPATAQVVAKAPVSTQADALGDRGVGLPAVVLQQLDDGLGQSVEHDGGRSALDRADAGGRGLAGGHSTDRCAWIDGWQVPGRRNA